MSAAVVHYVLVRCSCGRRSLVGVALDSVVNVSDLAEGLQDHLCECGRTFNVRMAVEATPDEEADTELAEDQHG